MCAMAIYQNDDLPDITIEKQLGPDILNGPFATVLKVTDNMVVLVTTECNIYMRMWCILEMFLATQWNRRVKVGQFSDGRIKVSSSWVGSDYRPDFETPLLSHSLKAADSKQAKCGKKNDEKSIQELIESTCGYANLDIAIEKARLDGVLAVKKLSSRLSTDERLKLRRRRNQRQELEQRTLFLLKREESLLSILKRIPTEQLSSIEEDSVAALNKEKSKHLDGLRRYCDASLKYSIMCNILNLKK